MSISSLITTDLPETPPNSRGSSSETNHAAEAPLVPPPESITSPVNDSALTITDIEALTAAAQLSSMRSRNDANEDNESITAPVEDESLNSALINSPTATLKDKGKGKDPELYDTNPPENGNSQYCQVDRSATHNNAENRLTVPAIENEIDLALSVLNLGAKRYECNTCPDGDPTLCSQCLTASWPQRASPDSPVSPSPVAKYEPNLYSSDSEDEGNHLSNAHKIRFNTSCHGNCLQLSAREGNAVFDLLPQRKQTHYSRHHGLEVPNGEMKCRRCELVQAHIDGRYEQRYKVRDYGRFERGDTVPLDEDAVDGTASERFGAAEYDGNRDHSMMSSNPPKLSRKTIKRLEAEKREWKPEPNSLMSAASDPPVPAADAVEPTRLPRYPKRSAARRSAAPTASINPEAAAQQPANKRPPSPPLPSDNQPPHTRPTHANRRSSASYSLASNYIHLATSTSSPYSSPYSPSHTQQNLKPFTPSPLKYAQTAADTEDRASQSSYGKQQQQHNNPTPLPTTTTMKNDKGAFLIGRTQPSGTQSQRGGNGRGPVKWFSPSPVKYIYGSVVQADEEKQKGKC